METDFKDVKKSEEALEAERSVMKDLIDSMSGEMLFTVKNNLKSSFPQWLPVKLRKPKAIESVVKDISNGKIPKSGTEVLIYREMMKEAWKRSGLENAEYEDEIVEVKVPKKKIKRRIIKEVEEEEKEEPKKRKFNKSKVLENLNSIGI